MGAGEPEHLHHFDLAGRYRGGLRRDDRVVADARLPLAVRQLVLGGQVGKPLKGGGANRRIVTGIRRIWGPEDAAAAVLDAAALSARAGAEALATGALLSSGARAAAGLGCAWTGALAAALWVVAGAAASWLHAPKFTVISATSTATAYFTSAHALDVGRDVLDIVAVQALGDSGHHVAIATRRRAGLRAAVAGAAREIGELPGHVVRELRAQCRIIRQGITATRRTVAGRARGNVPGRIAKPVQMLAVSPDEASASLPTGVWAWKNAATLSMSLSLRALTILRMSD